jgi:hypothetical protein
LAKSSGNSSVVSRFTKSLIPCCHDWGQLAACPFPVISCVQIVYDFPSLNSRKKDIYLKGSEDQLFLGPMLLGKSRHRQSGFFSIWLFKGSLCDCSRRVNRAGRAADYAGWIETLPVSVSGAEVAELEFRWPQTVSNSAENTPQVRFTYGFSLRLFARSPKALF